MKNLKRSSIPHKNADTQDSKNDYGEKPLKYTNAKREDNDKKNKARSLGKDKREIANKKQLFESLKLILNPVILKVDTMLKGETIDDSPRDP